MMLKNILLMILMNLIICLNKKNIIWSIIFNKNIVIYFKLCICKNYLYKRDALRGAENMDNF